MRLARSSSVAALMSCLLSFAWSSGGVDRDRGPGLRELGVGDLVARALTSGRAFVAWQGRGSNDLFWAKRTPSGWDRIEFARNPDFTQCDRHGLTSTKGS